jgi:hypothetical protein
MATHDYVIANGTGAAVRSDLNNALAAIVSNNSGSTEPATTYAFQWWADTTANVLKIRNSANNAWITLRELDGTMLIEDGSASSPGLSFASDTNSGLFGGSDTIGFATGGAERLEIGSSEVVFNDPSNDVDFRVESNGLTHALFVDAGNDRIGVGQSSPGYRLDVDAGSTTSGGLRVSGSSSPQIRLEEGSGVTASLQADGATGYVGTISNHPFVIRQNATERARIDSSGRLLVGTSSARGGFDNSSVVKSDLQVEGVGSAASANRTAISIVNNGSADADSAGLYLARSGGTSVGSFTAVTANDVLARITFSGADGSEFVQAASIEGVIDGTPGANDMPGSLRFSTTADGASSATERVRIDSSGNVGIGESAPLGKLHVKSADSGASSAGASADEFVIENSANAGMTILSGTTGQGLINFGDSDDVNVGSITYDHNSDFMSVKTNDTERARIGNLGRSHSFSSDGATKILANANGGNTSNYLIIGRHSSTTVDNGTNAFFVYTNGNVTNLNNSYGALSDVKLKENIVNANSQWDDIKDVQVRNFNFKEETGNPTHTQIGVVAQELETVSPGLVYETPDRDAEGNDLGTATKSVNYSVLYMKAVKALQEAMDRIETLEAKVAALEAG